MHGRTTRRVVLRLATAGALAVGMTIGVVAPLLGVSFAPVLSPSMRPALTEGDLAVVRTVDPAAIEVGTVLLIDLAAADVVAHRVVAIERQDGVVRVRTRGDANATADPAVATLIGPQASVVIGRIPAVGHLAVVLGTTPARVALIAIVLVALALSIARAMRREEDPMDAPRRPRPVTTLLGTALLAAGLITLTDAVLGPPSIPGASADATGPTVLEAALEQYDIVDAPADVVAALGTLLDDAIAVGVMDHGVLTVTAGQDPVSVPCFIGAHLRRERERWADVGPIWSQAYERLGLEPGGCTPGDDAPCGLVLRLRLMTDAARELAAREECDLDCAHRLEELQRRLDTTAQTVDALDVEQLGAGTDTARDAERLVEEARTVIGTVEDRIRVAEEEAPIPDPSFEDECETDDTADTTEGARP